MIKEYYLAHRFKGFLWMKKGPWRLEKPYKSENIAAALVYFDPMMKYWRSHDHEVEILAYGSLRFNDVCATLVDELFKP